MRSCAENGRMALKQQKMESEKKRLMEKEEEEIRLKQEKEKKRAALLGWGDTMTELQLGPGACHFIESVSLS